MEVAGFVGFVAAARIANRFMSVKIRLKRIGAKNKPAFRIVVGTGAAADSKLGGGACGHTDAAPHCGDGPIVSTP